MYLQYYIEHLSTDCWTILVLQFRGKTSFCDLVLKHISYNNTHYFTVTSLATTHAPCTKGVINIFIWKMSNEKKQEDFTGEVTVAC